MGLSAWIALSRVFSIAGEKEAISIAWLGFMVIQYCIVYGLLLALNHLVILSIATFKSPGSWNLKQSM